MSKNLMENKVVRAVVKSKWFPAIPQAITIWVFMVITWQLLFGPKDADYNLGSLYTWSLWWPLLPITFLLTGRFWCAICPFGLLNDVVQKAFGQNKPVPKFIKNYGIWCIDALFLFITWADHLFGIFSSPLLTGGLMLILITGVLVSGALWQRRTWCRYLCFLGGLAGNYARNGMVELRNTPEKCATCKSGAACYNGTATTAPCPVFEFPRQMETSENCNLCGNCVKSCPNDSIQVRLRPISHEIFSIHNRKDEPKLDEAFLAIVVMGIVLIKNTDDFAHPIWESLLNWVQTTTHTPYPIAFTLLFLVVVNIPGVILTLMSWVAQRVNGDSWKDNLTRFGFALIPLDMALVVSNTCPDFLGNARALIYSALALFGIESGKAPREILPDSVIPDVQIGLVIIGALLSLHAVYRISHHYFDAKGHVTRTLAPYSAMVVGFASVMLWIFTTSAGKGGGGGDAPATVAYVAANHNQMLSVAVVFGGFILATWATAWGRIPRAKPNKKPAPARDVQVARGTESLPIVVPSAAGKAE